MIRFFCHAEPTGARAELARRYAEAFVALKLRLRIIPVEFVQPSTSWAHLQTYFLTAEQRPYTNVVCTDPWWWFRYYTVGTRNVLITDQHPAIAAPDAPSSIKVAAGTKREVFQGRMVEFEVVEVPHTPPTPASVALQYEAIVVPTRELAEAWREAGGRQVVVVGLDLAERARDLEEVLGLTG